jgi:hypothetical protein
MIFDLIRNNFFSVVLSILIHFILLVFLSIIQNFLLKDINAEENYLSINLRRDEFNRADFNDPIEKENLKESKLEEHLKRSEESQANEFVNIDSLIQNSDTTNLEAIYIDDTRRIRINYPVGWVFIDQKVNSKLDGVTFWSEEFYGENIPYIHLETSEKALFSEKRFQFKKQLQDLTWHYNNPEIIGEYVIFEIYIRTKKDVDYKIKLIINGLEKFKSFQPKFIAIVKSFKIELGLQDIF